MQLSIGVQIAGGGAFDDEAFALLTHHAWRRVDLACKESGGQRGDVPERERRHDAEIEFPIVHAGAGRDAGVVAVLARVGDDKGEGPHRFAALSVRERIILRLPRSEGAGARQQIAEETALVRLVEAMGDLRFEADAGGAEESVAIRHACINDLDASMIEDAQRVLHGSMQTKVPAEAVAGSGRNQAERGRGSDERSGDFVHGAIAADSDHPFDAGGDGLASEGGGVADVFGEDNLGAALAREFADGIDQAGSTARAEINDESRFQREGKEWERSAPDASTAMSTLTGFALRR